MPIFKRIFLIVLDSVGIGEAPDAKEYDDVGADTLGHIADYVDGLHMPHLAAFGLSHIKEIKGIPKVKQPKAYYTKMQEASVGKDTLTGHWELMGLYIEEAFKTFPNGFPQALMDTLSEKTGRPILGNQVASGTVIIEELGEEHLKTGGLIIYTSADSVLQIASHEEVIPPKELYQICEIARELTLKDPYLVARVIARPFVGKPGHFIRTANRRDYALKPFGRTVLNELKDHGLDVIGIGKISDIYHGEGITESIKTVDNDDGMTKLTEVATQDFTGLCFVNLVDFDSKYGHRRDPVGYAQALEAFDRRLPELLQHLKDDDCLIITADHGNDPTHHGTDHTREYVPLLVHYPSLQVGKELPIRKTFADVGATIADNFNVPMPAHGESFLKLILEEKVHD